MEKTSFRSDFPPIFPPLCKISYLPEALRISASGSFAGSPFFLPDIP